ncbi:TonB-dependent receptor domain-containing protein [Bizionia sediminis]|uniref:TonB-dependent receptor domain-containing protein n=1 Tax=Bizionia sediminis TaxID=1737064 RepID=A0ABW5KR74_9FLAO
MKKITRLFFATAFLISAIAMAQSTVTGTIMDAEMNAPLPGANIIEEGTTNGVSSDFDGNFTIKTERTNTVLVISYVGYETKKVTVTGSQSIGNIVLSSNNTLEEVVIVGSGVIDLAEERATPIAVSTIKRAEIQERAVGNVEVSEIVKNTPSVYISGQTGFGDSQMFLRGFDQTNIAVLLNGQPVNGMEDGRVYWSNWSGIADVANGVQLQRGLGSSKLAISSVGGTMNLIMKSTDRNKGGFVRFMGGNDSYFKGTVSYDTGLSEKGWSFSVLLDHWQAHRKWAQGTFGSGQTYFLSAGYKPNENHTFNVLLTGAPQQHGQRWSQSKETLENTPKFNQHWGYTEGLNGTQYSKGIESERTNYYHKPVFNFNWDWNISEKSELATVAYASWGRGGGTGDRGRGRIRTADGQIDYFAIEQQALANDNGIGNESGERNTSYIRRSSVNNHAWYGLVTSFNHEITDELSFNVGADVRLYRGDHFRQVADFYGLTGWANDRPDGAVVTQSFDPKPWASLFDFADEGQRIDYDYSENINYQGAFGQIEYANDNFSVFFQGAVSNQSYQREGRFEGEGLGKSDKLDKLGYNLKGGVSYAIDPNSSRIYLNAGFYSRQPFLDNIFKDIRSSNDIFKNPEVDNEEITSFELGYKFKVSNFRADFNFYYTDWDNRVILGTDIDDNGTPGDDSDDIELNVFDRGVRQIHKGVELDMEYRITNAISLTGYVSGGSWEYDGTSDVSVYNDRTGELISESPGTDRNGVKITNAPQFTAGFGTRARIIDGLTLYGNINYYDRLFENDGNSVQTENVGRIAAYSLTDVGVSYDFEFGGQRLTFVGNVYNVFDEVRIQQSDNFGYFNTNGLTFNASVKYKF